MSQQCFYGVSRILLRTRSGELSRRFYQALAPQLENVIVPHDDEGTLNPGELSGWLVEFGVDDVPASIDRCLALGARPAGETQGATQLLDPNGVRFAVGRYRSSPQPGDGAAVLADLFSRSTPESSTFYAQAFGLDRRVLPDDPVDYLQFLVGTRHVLGVLDATTFLGSESDDLWVPYLRFADVDSAVERATALGAIVVAALSDSPTGRYAIVRDPAGHLMGVWDAASLFTPVA